MGSDIRFEASRVDVEVSTNLNDISLHGCHRVIDYVRTRRTVSELVIFYWGDNYHKYHRSEPI